MYFLVLFFQYTYCIVFTYTLSLCLLTRPGRSADLSPFCLPPRGGEGPLVVEPQDGVCLPAGTQFDFNPSNLEQLQEEDHDSIRYLLTLVEITLN